MKPTPQAIRAAEALFFGEFLTEEETAIIIDREMSGWRPIKDAPKDGTRLVLYDMSEGIAVIGRWGKHNHVPLYGWIRQIELYGEEVDGFDATHFRELPAPPTP